MNAGPKRNAAVMDDEAMRRLEKEVDMINELIGLTSNPKPAVSEEPVAIGKCQPRLIYSLRCSTKQYLRGSTVESASRAKSRPASVGRAGTKCIDTYSHY